MKKVPNSERAMADTILKGLAKRISRHSGLSVFSTKRSKFEGWMKVETVDLLVKKYPDVVPEKGLVDVSFAEWSLELKTVNTNFKFSNTKNSIHRPITKNVESVIVDIAALRRGQGKSAVVFIAFPANDEHVGWKKHLNKIQAKLDFRLMQRNFNFKNGIPAVIYFGKVR